jgi:hypothetical protein
MSKLINKMAVNKLDAPMPGQSLTTNPDTPQAWETPPEITDVKEGREYLFEKITNPDNIGNILFMLNSDIPVSKIASLLVKDGFRKGLWSPDLVLLLLEPTALMLIAVAKEVGIDPVIINPKLKQKMASNSVDLIKIKSGMAKKNIKEGAEVLEGLMAPTGGMTDGK